MSYPDSNDTRLDFDPVDGTLYAHSGRRYTSPDALTADSIADDGFHAPKYSFDTHNASHQGGYHVHLRKQHSGKPRLTDLCFTRRGNMVIAYRHGEGKSDITIDSLSDTMIETLRSSGLVDVLEAERPWTRQIDERKVIAAFPLYTR